MIERAKAVHGDDENFGDAPGIETRSLKWVVVQYTALHAATVIFQDRTFESNGAGDLEALGASRLFRLHRGLVLLVPLQPADPRSVHRDLRLGREEMSPGGMEKKDALPLPA